MTTRSLSGQTGFIIINENFSKTPVTRLLLQLLLLDIALVTVLGSIGQAKVIELDGKFTEYLEEGPSRGWLIKFYAPWCHHCRELEPTYANVAEALYHMHDNLIVARVDCTKYPELAEQFSIKSFPTIKFIDGNKRFTYYGERNVEDIVSFADRLHGPSIKTIDTCQDLKHQIDSHQVIILSNLRNRSEELYLKYSYAAGNYSTNFWFYQTVINHCEGLFETKDTNKGDIYILKSDKPKPISYRTTIDNDEKGKLINFIKYNTFPIFSKLGSSYLKRGLETKKLLVIAILEEHKPTKRMTLSNSIFKEVVSGIAKDYAENEAFLFGWSSDFPTLNSLAIKTIEPVPNLMVLAQNLSYYMPEDIPTVSNKARITQELDKLSRHIKRYLGEIERGYIFDKMVGGDGLFHSTKRNIFNLYTILSIFLKTFKGEPLVISSILFIPVLGFCAVIFTICCDSNSTDDNEVPLKGEEHEKED